MTSVGSQFNFYCVTSSHSRHSWLPKWQSYMLCIICMEMNVVGSGDEEDMKIDKD